MIVHRFMSDNEYQRLIKGETLINTRNHANDGSRTTSIGFCFFTEPPDEVIHWLSGNVCTDWCVTFDIQEDLLTESKGRYRDTEKDSFSNPAVKWRREYCLQEYSIHTARIIEATDKWTGYGFELFDLLLNLLKD